MGVAAKILLLSCLRAEIYVISYSGQWPPSFLYDIPRHQTASLFFIACFMALKTCYYLRNCVAIMFFSWYTCKYKISTAILDFWLPVSSGSVTDSTIEKSDPVNMEVAVGILFLASLEAEIPLGLVLPPFNTNVTKITFNIWGFRDVDHWGEYIRRVTTPYSATTNISTSLKKSQWSESRRWNDCVDWDPLQDRIQ